MDLRYPIGKFEIEKEITPERLSQWILVIENTPENLAMAVDGLTPEQLNTPYRPEGWTVSQVIHHLVDSHMNAYIRFKLALTEDVPTIRTYDQDLWAKLSDAKSPAVDISVSLITSLHQRWNILLRSLSAEDFARKFNHPEIGEMTVGTLLHLYAWHGSHHVAHINSLRSRMGW